VFPASTGDVSTVLAAANDRGVPVTPYAAGTGLEGNAVPVEAGISLDLTRMDAVLDVRSDDFQIDVEPGVMGSTIEARAGEHGLWFPPLPSSGDISTIGGMIATDAGGMGTVKYGEVADWLVRLEVALADGTVVETGTRAIKSSAGYNLTELVAGSEGTLGVVTEATLELDGRPRQIRGGRAVFEDLDDASAAVRDAVQSGVDVAKIELVDETSATMANAYAGVDLPDAPTVFLEFHADHGVDEEVAFCEDVFAAHDPLVFEMAAADDGMDELWQARKDLAFAIRSYDPDLTPLHPGDVTVPISEYGTILRYAKDLAAEHDLVLPCFGHAGDGNVHYSVLVDENDPDAVETGERVYRDIVEKAIDLGGTSTGEHGIGLGKREFLERERGPAAVDTMQRLKHTLDPNDILNPGKIFDDD
jgi:D-lactate dehydrogenase (cytochrome)